MVFGLSASSPRKRDEENKKNGKIQRKLNREEKESANGRLVEFFFPPLQTGEPFLFETLARRSGSRAAIFIRIIAGSWPRRKFSDWSRARLTPKLSRITLFSRFLPDFPTRNRRPPPPPHRRGTSRHQFPESFSRLGGKSRRNLVEKKVLLSLSLSLSSLSSLTRVHVVALSSPFHQRLWFHVFFFFAR